jgi:SpoVK/Ycf46/Vps4 family AAA+-type ATPase
VDEITGLASCGARVFKGRVSWSDLRNNEDIKREIVEIVEMEIEHTEALALDGIIT